MRWNQQSERLLAGSTYLFIQKLAELADGSKIHWPEIISKSDIANNSFDTEVAELSPKIASLVKIVVVSNGNVHVIENPVMG
jgi:hypothetical protein